MAFTIPSQGFVFWPIGTGDSTTIALKDDVLVQVDLNNLVCADDEVDPRTPIVEKLVELLPKQDGKPYLQLFILTHPDKDHCCGFAELLDKVTVGELWFTPRIFREYDCDLCEDAIAFRDEAQRRITATIKRNLPTTYGHRRD